MNRPGTPLPAYFTTLAPFRDLFRAGTPVLTYHKLGPRPARVRLKGLYLSQPLFVRQLRALRAAGFASADLAEAATGADNTAGRVALTFDDGFENVLRHGLTPLAETGFRAIEFLVADRLGQMNDWEQAEGEAPARLMDAAQVRDWLAAGHDVGSHTRSHPWLTRLSPAAAREEIAASRKQLEDLFGRTVRHFCYPYGDWNPAVRDLVIEAGYATASTTEFGVNTAATDRFGLKRITARYQSLRWRTLWPWLRARWHRD
jgi:peptidoglycan/xylan/chitin deacetylase (PgdA/CDA1 family)